MLLSTLIQDNSLTSLKPNLYSKDSSINIGYTDGDLQEKRALAILTSANDRSSTSIELSEQCDDRFTTYHFSPLRGNLVKHIPIKSDDVVLEIGCGFGSITRALAEKKPKELIAIEGSLNRAKGASLRCEGLEDVNIIHANIHDLVIPLASADYIVLVGVFEYIKNFYPQDTLLSSEELVVDFLKKLKGYLRPHGQIVIAIENQLGLKYFLGYQEDHFEEIYVGLYDYPAPRYDKIKTFGQDKWVSLFRQADLVLTTLDLPFPDYKFPHTIINADFLERDRYSANLLYNYQAANYDNNYVTPVQTNLVWPCLVSNQIASRFADSFLFFVSSQLDQQSLPLDFIHYPNYQRKSEFWSVVAKEKEVDQVQRYLVQDFSDKPIETKPYYSLPLLAHLLSQIAYAGDWEQLSEWFKRYLNYLHTKHDQEQLDHDATFSNLLVNQAQAELISFDHEWLGKFSVTPEFVLFRSILYWSVDNRALLTRLKQKVTSIKQFLQLIFEQLDISLSEEAIGSFIQQEVTIAKAIFRQVLLQDFQDLLELTIPDSTHDNTYESFVSQKISELTELAEKRFSIMNEMDALVKDRDQYIKSLEAEKNGLQDSLSKKEAAFNQVEQEKNLIKGQLQYWNDHPYQSLWRKYISRSSHDA